MGLDITCFICNKKINFTLKTIDIPNDHVHTCIQNELDSNDLERFPSKEEIDKIKQELIEKNKQIESLKLRISSLEDENRLSKKIKINQEIFVQPKEDKEDIGVAEVIEVTERDALSKSTSSSSGVNLERFSQNIKSMIINPKAIPIIVTNQQEENKCYFSQQRSILGFSNVKFKDQDFVGLFNDEEIIFKLQDLTHFVECNSSKNSPTRFEVTINGLSMVICNPNHLNDTKVWKYMKSYFSIKDENKIYRPIAADDTNVKCKACPNKCSGAISVKGSKSTPLKSSYMYYCSVACFHKFIVNSKKVDLVGLLDIGMLEEKKEKKEKKSITSAEIDKPIDKPTDNSTNTSTTVTTPRKPTTRKSNQQEKSKT